MSQPGKSWMPTTDVVRPQPSSGYINAQQTTFNLNSSIYHIPNLQHQKVGAIKGSINSREFLQMNGNSIIQQKLIEDQRKLKQNALKKRHFNEQKEKFCAFSAKGTDHHASCAQIYPQSANSTRHKIEPVQPPKTNSMHQDGTRQPLPLPNWLMEPFLLPDVYKKAGGLVESQDGFVDTSRAYMLLMRTNVQPALLGVMWEMVNRTLPGRLKMGEFYGLLALVALVQNGQTIPSADCLVSLTQPICPVINHPVLAQSQQSEASVSNKEIAAAKTTDDLEEFDDFVSAQTVVASTPIPTNTQPAKHSPIAEKKAVSNLETSSVAKKAVICRVSISPPTATRGNSIINNSVRPAPNPENSTPGGLGLFVEAGQIPSSKEGKINPVSKCLPTLQMADCKAKNDKINLPILGASPKHLAIDEDFADFQSSNSSSSEVHPHRGEDLLFSSGLKEPDKYAVFRGIGSRSSDVAVVEPTKNDNFGDFQAAKSSMTYRNSNPLVASPPTTFFEADLQRTYSVDPFGEFEDISNLDHPMPGTALKVASIAKPSDKDDDFGDFVSSSVSANTYSGSSSYNLTMVDRSETQSVASLELSDLHETMTSSSNMFLGHIDLLSNAAHERPEENSSMQENNSKQSSDIEDIFASATQSPVLINQVLRPSTVDESSTISDKYSSMREGQQGENKDPRSETWKKCLTGCKKLLCEGASTLQGIPVEDNLLRDVLSTSQMQDYLSNLNEIWRICQRILSSTRHVRTCTQIEDLLADNQTTWTAIVSISECQFDKANVKNSQTDEKHACSICLSHGGADLSYGGHNYHSTCANLWLNAVDVILPAMSQFTPSDI